MKVNPRRDTEYYRSIQLNSAFYHHHHQDRRVCLQYVTRLFIYTFLGADWLHAERTAVADKILILPCWMENEEKKKFDLNAFSRLTEYNNRQI